MNRSVPVDRTLLAPSYWEQPLVLPPLPVLPEAAQEPPSSLARFVLETTPPFLVERCKTAAKQLRRLLRAHPQNLRRRRSAYQQFLQSHGHDRRVLMAALWMIARKRRKKNA